MIEVIATSVDDAITIEKCGVKRIELSTALSEFGITPSYGLIKKVLEKVKISVFVLIRPHPITFVYNNDDMQVMKDDIQIVKKLGADGVILGVLNKENKIDEEKLKELLDCADGLDVVFHRAIDSTPDPVESVRTLLKYPQIKRIVTAGGKGEVMDNLETIKKMVEAAENKVAIMLGGGLNQYNYRLAVEKTGAQEVHFGRGVRENFHHTGKIDPLRCQAITLKRF